MVDPVSRQISYDSSLLNPFQLNLGHDVKLFGVAMKAATGMNSAEQVMRPANVFSTSLVTVSDAALLISILSVRTRTPESGGVRILLHMRIRVILKVGSIVRFSIVF
jgi:hypothetical protein